jgi:hypothetical protein
LVITQNLQACFVQKTTHLFKVLKLGVT